jgi:DNA mismatch repair protein MutS
MKQYAQIKARYPGTILLFRMGDFYETFEEDAKIASKVLSIALTKRGDGAAGDVPLAGFPHHALDSYLPRLLKAGYRVAVCDQLEDPRLAKGIVKRDVVEVVTPGIAFSEKVLNQRENNYLAALALPSALANGEDVVGFSLIDVSTAEFSVSEFPLRQLPEQVATSHPSELLVQKRDAVAIEQLLRKSLKGITTKVEDWIFNYDYARELLLTHFRTHSLKGFGIEEFTTGIVAAGAIMNYLQETQRTNLLHIRKITPFSAGDHIVLDPATKRNLELAASMEGGTDGSLISVLDKTETPMGGRLLKRWLTQPLKKVEAIRERLDAVAELTQLKDAREHLKESLSRIGDLERLTSRVCTARAAPRELIAIRMMLLEIEQLREALSAVTVPALAELRESMVPLPEVSTLIATSIEDEPSATIAQGGVIRKGYNRELDELRQLSRSGKQWIVDLQKQERDRTGIPSLKVGFNNVFGYYIEVTNTHAQKIPVDYIRKQTLTNAERYITPELKEYEERILHAEEKTLVLETELFEQVRLRIAEHAEAIQNNARLVATLDCLLCFAVTAVEYGYVCPDVNDSLTLQIVEGRHPVIEQLLPPGETYTPNSTLLDTTDNQILIITGPNMSGKSSYLRQTGLIVLMAQVGSFVPATKATIGVVDKIFTRVGASDNIATGESTFLVEMNEAANIVNTATTRSLILLDEVGRGTSTFDGISIAWALTEYLHEHVGARTLFATHYHELNELADLYPRIKNLKVEVREYGDKVIFLHKVTPGFADHSYGIQVAQMAGLPAEVTERAKTILRNLEGTELTVHNQDENKERRAKGRVAPTEIQMTLFDIRDDSLHEELRKIDVNKLTPLEALQKLAELKEKL